jgi:glutathione S-transferase
MAFCCEESTWLCFAEICRDPTTGRLLETLGETLGMERPELLYFPVGGRAVAVRLCMYAAFGKDGWDNEALTFDEFKAEKAKLAADPKSSRLLSGSLPQLKIGSKSFGQSCAIMRFANAVAKQKGVTGASKLYVDEPLDLLVAEEVAEYSFEILNKCPQDPDPETKKKLREAYAQDKMKAWCGILETRLGEKEGAYLFGDSPCYADICMYTTMAMVKEGSFDHVPASYLDQFPKLKKLTDDFPSSEIMTTYRKDMGDKAYV